VTTGPRRKPGGSPVIVAAVEDVTSGAVEVVPPTWSTWREALGVTAFRPHLRRTMLVAVAVGSVLFCISQLDVALRGDATTGVWVKSAVTYLVPFAVSNAGVLVGSRRTVD
jgi:hypothetical protein